MNPIMRALLLVLCGMLAVCTPGPSARVCANSTSGTNGGVNWTVTGCVIVARSSRIEVRWDGASGALVGLRNVATGTELLAGSAHSAWSARVDPTTDDIWSARAPQTPPGGPTTLTSFTARPLDGGGFTFDLAFSHSGPMTVVQHVTMRDDDSFASWTTDVAVDRSSTVVSIASPELLGVAQLPDEQLAWPWHEGVVFPQPGNALRWMQYPAAASMQWMELFTPTEGLYLGVLDPNGNYKELRFGYDPTLGRSDQPREMAVSFYGYATVARPQTTPAVEIGVAPTGGWYWGADRYRAFLERSGMMRPLPKIASELRGWHRGFSRTGKVDSPTRRTFAYCSIPPLLMPPDYTQRTGISVLTLYAWHYDGLDTYYPDYDFLSKNAADPTCLRGSDLASSMKQLAARPQANRVMFYLNGHIADPASDWFQDPAHADAQALGADGQPYLEQYPTQPGRNYHVMCPSAQTWADRLDAKAMDLRTLAPPGAGALGIYWDQVEEVPAEPCYVRTHGHSTPHSAFPEGYRALFQRIGSDFGSTEGGAYIFAAEGANDYYSQFIDVAGGMPGRPPGYAPHKCDRPIPFGIDWPCGARHAPEIGRYAMGARFLGLANFGGAFDANDEPILNTNRGTREEFTRAFLLGDPFRTMEVGYYSSPTDPYATINRFAFPRYTDIYAAEPEIYFYGRYLDANGLTLDATPAEVMGTLISGVAMDRLGVQLWNQTDADRTVGVVIHLDSLGLDGRSATGVVDLDGKASLPFQSDRRAVTFSALVPSHDVKAFKVAL
jgi:hypothetical protein